MKHLKTFEHESTKYFKPKKDVKNQYEDWAETKYLDDYSIIRSTLRFLDGSMPITKEEGYRSGAWYNKYITFYFKDLNDEIFDRFKKFMDKNGMELYYQQNFDNGNTGICVETSKENYDRMAKIYDETKKYNL